MAIQVGAIARGPSQMSDLERALLGAAARPELAGGAAMLADAITSAGRNVEPERLTGFAQQLGWAAALRRVGSVSDALAVEGLAGRLDPLYHPGADLDLEPGEQASCVWRDARWRVRWGRSRNELRNVARE